MNMGEKIARAAEEEFLRQYEASKWETAKDAAEGFDADAMRDAVLDAISNIDDVDFDAFYLGYKHHRGSVQSSIRAGLRAMFDAVNDPTE